MMLLCLRHTDCSNEGRIRNQQVTSSNLVIGSTPTGTYASFSVFINFTRPLLGHLFERPADFCRKSTGRSMLSGKFAKGHPVFALEKRALVVVLDRLVVEAMEKAGIPKKCPKSRLCSIFVRHLERELFPAFEIKDLGGPVRIFLRPSFSAKEIFWNTL